MICPTSVTSCCSFSLTLRMPGISVYFMSPNQLFSKFRSGIASEYETVLIQIRPDVLSGLIWLQNVLQNLSADDTSSQRVIYSVPYNLQEIFRRRSMFIFGTIQVKNPIMVCNYGILFYCTRVAWARPQTQ